MITSRTKLLIEKMEAIDHPICDQMAEGLCKLEWTYSLKSTAPILVSSTDKVIRERILQLKVKHKIMSTNLYRIIF